MRAAVLVPTYRRPRDLTRCLRAIATQTRAADEVVVVGRRGDRETFRILEDGDAVPLIGHWIRS
jgi:GT2 family glycosyltransferase